MLHSEFFSAMWEQGTGVIKFHENMHSSNQNM